MAGKRAPHLEGPRDAGAASTMGGYWAAQNEIRPTSSRPAATLRFVRASAFPPRRPLTSRPSSLRIGRGVMRRLNIEDRPVLSLWPRTLTHVR
ncbi:hypothetical protein NDU88_006282 [Pleurodeles waltl]|uniref:Uncharacterized protein n=1 Tax=Pleurodeles waltl TaxID=8319 RepID=A0AAV7QIK9_PLEWA|nr:hypothetical protein NDU88_006282 [Pleurodeles waltl]